MSSARFSTDSVSGVETVRVSGGHSPVLIDNGGDLFGAEFQRDGRDLVLLVPDGQPIRIVDYFFHPVPVDLVAENGGLLRGATIEIMAGPAAPGQYAQAGAPQVDQPIGQVETLDGAASVQRADGTEAALLVGMKVFQYDVVKTDAASAMSITFADGTIFSLAAGSRMVLDQLIYDPDSSDNSGAFSLIEGSFVFIAGQVAKTGGMEITTPAATMGIRGTTVRVDVSTFGGESTVACSLNHDPDGGLGRIEIFDLSGNLLNTVTNTAFRWVMSSEQDGLRQILRTPQEIAHDTPLLDAAANAFTLALRRVASGETFVDFPGRDRGVPPDRDGQAEPEADPGIGAGLSGEALGQPDPDAGEGGKDAAPPPRPAIRPAFPLPPAKGDLDGTNDTFLNVWEDTRYAGTLPKQDADGNPLAYELLDAPASGIVQIAANGKFVYQPEGDFSGLDQFVYVVTNADGERDVAIADVWVMPVNDAPHLTLAPFELAETDRLTIDLADFADDADPGEDGSTLRFTVAVQDATPGAVAGYGTITVTGSILTFLPGADFDALGTGEVRALAVEVTAQDAAGAAVTEEFSITVTGVNDAPVLTAGALMAVEDGAAALLDLATLAFDAEDGADGLSYALLAPPADGTASLDGSLLSFAPGTGFHDLAPGETREITLAVSATDADGAVAVQEIAVTVTGTDEAPAAVEGAPQVDTPNAELTGRDITGEMPRAGAQAVDGGAGQGVLRIDMAGDLDDALFPVADIAGIEVLDLDNGSANTLDLTLSDVLDITDTGEAGIGALVAAATHPVLTVLGDAADEITLTPQTGERVEISEAPPVSESSGHEAVLYSFVDGAGEILASLAIDAEVTVHTMMPAA